MNFEWNDLRAVVTVVNVMLIMRFGLAVSWFGLAIATLGLCADFHKYRIDKYNFRWNGVIMHVMNAILNIHFLCIM